MFNKLNKLANKLNITCVENTAKNRLNARTKQLMTAKSGRAIIKNNSRIDRILATMAGGEGQKIEVKKRGICLFSKINELPHIRAPLKPIIIS